MMSEEVKNTKNDLKDANKVEYTEKVEMQTKKTSTKKTTTRKNPQVVLKKLNQNY